MNDASRTAEDLRQELLLVGESHHIEAKRCMQVDHSVMEPVCAFAIDNAAYRAINRTDTLNASTHLRRLRDQGLLAMKGSGNRCPSRRHDARMTCCKHTTNHAAVVR